MERHISEEINEKMERIRIERRRKRRRILPAILVLLTVSYILSLPAISKEQETFCGYVEHVHQPACFDENGEPSCGMEEHRHTEACFVQAEPISGEEMTAEEEQKEDRREEPSDESEPEHSDEETADFPESETEREAEAVTDEEMDSEDTEAVDDVLMDLGEENECPEDGEAEAAEVEVEEEIIPEEESIPEEEIATEEEPVLGAQAANVRSGTWNTCKWTLDSEGLLTIFPIKTGYNGTLGEGAPPWYNFAGEIRSVKFEKNVKTGKDSSWLFGGCTNLETIDFSNLDTSNTTNFQCMFYNCTSLKSLDLSTFRTKSAVNMSFMFGHCRMLTELDLHTFDTGNVTNMNAMFAECNRLETLDVSSFRTPKVTSMVTMFSQCHALRELDLSGFDMRKVTGADHMFDFDRSLGKIILGNNFTHKNITANDPTENDSFPRGIWMREEDGESYSSPELTLKLYEDAFPGTYIRQVSTALNADFASTYVIGELPRIDRSVVASNYLEVSGNQVLVRGNLLKGNEIPSIPGSVTLLFENVVTDADGNRYDLEWKISGIRWRDSAETKYVQYPIFYLNNGIPRMNHPLGSVGGVCNVSADVTLTIRDKDGSAAGGSYIFSAYDLDVADRRGQYGAYSEGVTLGNGFDLETIRTSDSVAAGSSTLTVNGNRITGSRSDSATEVSEFLVKADASGATFTWTAGSVAYTEFLSFYRPNPVGIRKTDPFGVPLAGASLKLSREGSGELTEIETFVSAGGASSEAEDSVRRMILSPGTYLLEEADPPEGYQQAETIRFRIDNDYHVHLLSGNGQLEGAASSGEESAGGEVIDIIRMTDEPIRRNLRIRKTVIGAEDETEGPSFDFEIKITRPGMDKGSWDGLALCRIDADGEVHELQLAEYLADAGEKESVTLPFSMGNRESAELTGIPSGSPVTIREVGHDGYITFIKDSESGEELASGDTAAIEMDRDRDITVYNNPGISLPETGGPGRSGFAVGGALMLLFAGMIGVLKLRDGYHY